MEGLNVQVPVPVFALMTDSPEPVKGDETDLCFNLMSNQKLSVG